ncbi:hypothetical protein LTS18_002258 [Coniosporium uncinatum]|uniref:Uncharacterized protein n=1 Tax=Coniosporium uncinatum TaxID=93489 RepID=A0ACC3D854_9PEZI|nr:hypothetical protein LTS18_002258 [Coniosporium uncinatum]
MDDKLRRTLAAPDFESWRARLWREISDQAITEGYVQEYELRGVSALDARIQNSKAQLLSAGGDSRSSNGLANSRSGSNNNNNSSNSGSGSSRSSRRRAGGQMIGRPLREVLARQGQRYRLSPSTAGGDAFDFDDGYDEDDGDEEDEEQIIDFDSPRWSSLFHRLVEIRYLFRAPVSRCVHARFLHAPPPATAFGAVGSGMGAGVGMGFGRVERVDVGCLSFHTNPHPSLEEKKLFESRKRELLEWRQGGGVPPRDKEGVVVRRSPKVDR